MVLYKEEGVGGGGGGGDRRGDRWEEGLVGGQGEQG